MIPRNDVRSSASLIRRLLWLVMGLSHAPGLLDSWQSVAGGAWEPARIGGCLWLTLATVFFALKVWDAPFLRIRANRRTLIAACLVVALLHVDVVRPEGAPTMVADATALVATTWLVGSLPPIRRILVTSLTRARSIIKCHKQVALFTETQWLDVARPHCWLLAMGLFLLRAPPL